MKRGRRRRLAFWRAKLARLVTAARRVVVGGDEVHAATPAADLAEADAFVRDAEALRGGVAKLGQLRAYLDGTTPEARARLGALWDRLPADEPARIRRVVHEDLGDAPEVLFARWDDQPLAAASLGQVHAADGLDGARLAVKVQYPDVAAALRDDLASSALLRRMVGADLGDAVDGEALERLRAQLLGELDYRAEARALERFGHAFAGDAAIVVPRVHPERSAARVLTMERLDGTTLPALARDGDEAARSAVGRTLLRFALGAPLQHRVLNADPHPGNYLVLDAARGRVGFVDFGCVAALSDAVHAADHKLWRAMILRDGEALRHAVHLQGLVRHADVFEGATWREWERQLAAPFLAREPVTLTPEYAARLVTLTGELMQAARMGLPADALLLWRQRLGALSVIATLRPRLRWRTVLGELLDDRRNPLPLVERYR